MTIVLHGVVLFICVTTYWKAGEMEDPTGSLVSAAWAGLSALVFLMTWLLLGWGWMGIIVSQVGLGIGIAIVRAAKDA